MKLTNENQFDFGWYKVISTFLKKISVIVATRSPMDKRFAGGVRETKNYENDYIETEEDWLESWANRTTTLKLCN